MNTLMALFGDFNFGEKIAQFFTIIPKVIYFLFACLTSAIDAMQSLIRKLAGLDIYYVSGKQQAGDPLKEFIYGILGFGEGKAAYGALHTVFISFIIFGVIVLVVSTMVAIIKSHYKEDTQGTDPWKYIYQAIKAILSALVVPVAVVLGFMLTNFLLTTLDQITAGTAQESQIIYIYGSDAANSLQSEKVKIGNTTTDTYIYYDFFSFDSPTNTTTFSGLLFKASAYQANRARTTGVGGGQLIIGNMKFGDTSAGAANDFKNSEGVVDANEFVAYQIDYAFQNNLHLANKVDYTAIQEATGVSVYSAADILGKLGSYGSFSKYYVALVWQFYDLWQFNFIVAFAGVFALFTIILSIVMGLMSRIIKGAAYFLVYPAILGIAPLDEFKAFKSWSSEFIKTILMAIGSIIGINLVLLLMPYLQLITFFDNGLLNYIINIVLLVVAISMAKDIITMVNNFVGGADAVSAGNNLKGDVAANIKKGASLTAKAGLGTARVGVAAAAGAFKLTAKQRANWRKSRLEGKPGKDGSFAKFEKAEQELATARQNQQNTYNSLRDKYNTKGEITNAGNDAVEKYKKHHKGYTQEELNRERQKAERKQLDKLMSDKEYSSLKSQEGEVQYAKLKYKFREGIANHDMNREEAIKKKYGLKVGEDGNYRAMTKAEIKENKAKERAEKIAKGEPVELSFGEKIKQIGKNFAKEIDGMTIGKTIADSFLKTANEVNSNFGVDKVVKAATDMFQQGLTFKGGIHDAKPKLEGDKLAAANAKKAENQGKEQIDLLKKIAESSKKTEEATKNTATATTKAANNRSNNSSSNNNTK